MLKLNKETIRKLDDSDLQNVRGGTWTATIKKTLKWVTLYVCLPIVTQQLIPSDTCTCPQETNNCPSFNNDCPNSFTCQCVSRKC